MGWTRLGSGRLGWLGLWAIRGPPHPTVRVLSRRSGTQPMLTSGRVWEPTGAVREVRPRERGRRPVLYEVRRPAQERGAGVAILRTLTVPGRTSDREPAIGAARAGPGPPHGDARS